MSNQLANIEIIRKLLIKSSYKFEDLWLFDEFYVDTWKTGYIRSGLHVRVFAAGCCFGESDCIFPVEEIVSTLLRIAS